jgi:hypothetical protein
MFLIYAKNSEEFIALTTPEDGSWGDRVVRHFFQNFKNNVYSTFTQKNDAIVQAVRTFLRAFEDRDSQCFLMKGRPQ